MGKQVTVLTYSAEDMTMRAAAEYKKTIHLGKVDYNHNGRKNCAVDVEIEIRIMENKNSQKELSMTGNVWNPLHSDIYSGGQNGDTLAELFKGNAKVQRMIEIWDRWHLNGMKATCEHQRALDWEKLASQKVIIYSWTLTGAASKQRREAEKEAMDALKAGKTVKLTDESLKMLALSHSFKTHLEKLPKSLADFYEPTKATSYSQPKETKTLGWLSQNDHPEGILSKPCPVCGYKYGSAWTVEPLPEEIEAEVKTW